MSRSEKRPHDEGAVSTEYLFLIVFVALAIVLGATAFGTELGDSFERGGEQVTDSLTT